MSGAQVVGQLLVGNVLLGAAWPAMAWVRRQASRPVGGLSARQGLRLAQVGIALALGLPLAGLGQDRPEVPTHAAQVWSAPSYRDSGAGGGGAAGLPTLSFSPMPTRPDLGRRVLAILAWFGLACGAWTVWRLAPQALRLRRLLAGAHRVRRVGRVEVLVHDGLAVPLAFWRPGRAYVLLPAAMVATGEAFRIALRHELQHHRQRDTLWAHLEWALLVPFGWNPALRAGLRLVSDLQEFACDEALVSRRIPPQAYARCLLEAAQLGLKSRVLLAGTTGMAAGTSGPLLRKRIDMMFETRKAGASRFAMWGLGTVMAFSLGGAAFAARGVVRDRRVTLEEAQQMARTMPPSKFPITLNEAVLRQLNRYVGTPDGRAYMRDSLARMQAYRPRLVAQIAEYGLPEELLAVPIIESGYRNFKARHAAGLWMFIVGTARNYDLRVDAQVDDRLDVALETDAAMRYLNANFLRFRDWGLALLAYNAGENRVQQGIDATGSRDAWKLIEAGYGGDKDYLAGLTAAVLILRNPNVLE